ncbi:MAG: hypothetical protein ACR2JY_03565 [Chloroflexota bacterium]
MTRGVVEQIVNAVLYEGYILYPYRPSSVKNRQRWTFGGIYPQQYSRAQGVSEPSMLQTECLVLGDEQTVLDVRVRFLHLVDRTVGALAAPIREMPAVGEPSFRLVEALRVGGRVFTPWQEAMEREVSVSGVPLGALTEGRQCQAIAFPATRQLEPVIDPAGEIVGVLLRCQVAIQGTVEVAAQRLEEGLFRISVRVENVTGGPLSAFGISPPSVGESQYQAFGGPPRPELHSDRPGTDLAQRCASDPRMTPYLPARSSPPRLGERSGERAGPTASRDFALLQAFVSAHVILGLRAGAFVSLLDPPERYVQAAAECSNVGVWPVLVGAAERRDTMLASPIILYDYPEVAPESPGDLFDGTEIDEILTLRILAMTDAEKEEMRQTDERARALLERTEQLQPAQLARLHGVMRSPHVGEGRTS